MYWSTQTSSAKLAMARTQTRVSRNSSRRLTAELYLAAQSIGEIRRGLENIRHRGDLPQAKRLEKWLDLVADDYADRVLSFDEECAQVWGRLMSSNHQHPIDKQIAAIALIDDLKVVTRNLENFQGTGVELINPFVH